MATSHKKNPVTISILAIVFTALAIASCLFYNPTNDINKQSEILNSTVVEPVVTNATNIVKIKKTKPLLNPMFPRCYTHHIYTALSGILTDLHKKHYKCINGKCTARNSKQIATKETTGLIFAYAAVALLLISLFAAFVEVYKAKKETVKSKGKPELSRRCSLADLTVLRHNRRESFMRRDSSLSLSIGESSGRVSLKSIGRKMSRPRLRVN